MADSFASDPDELKKLHSRSPGAMRAIRSARSSIGWLRKEKRYVKLSARDCCSSASTTRGWLWPRSMTIAPPQASR